MSFVAALSACQKKPFSPVRPDLRNPGTTGYTNLNGTDYTVGSDEERVLLATEALAPKDDENINEEEAQRLSLAQSITKGRVLRFDQHGKTTRFGEASVKVILEMTDNGVDGFEHIFEAPLALQDNEFHFSSTPSQGNSALELSGSFKDTPANDSSQGKLLLRQKSSSGDVLAESQILITAYLGELRVRVKRDETPSPSLQSKLQMLESYPYAWVNNFVVVMGRSFFDYILIRKSQTLHESQGLSFSGEALRTTQEQSNANRIQGSQGPTSITLIGDGEENNLRTFEFGFKSEDNSEEDSETVMVDIDSTQSQAQMHNALDPHFDPNAPEESAPTAPETPIQTPGQTPTSPQMPESTPPQRPSPQAAVPSASAFLSDRSGVQKIQSMHQDLLRNTSAPEVQAWIAAITGQASPPKYRSGNSDRNDYPRRFQKFLRNANPFRNLIRDVFNHYELPSAMAYLTVNESNFFIDGGYPVQSNTESTAFGAFQFLKGTAGNPTVNMRVDMNQNKGQTPPTWDERHYFAPSACGAAAYFSYLTNMFKEGDRTLALLAYGIGEGAAAAAIECHEGNSSATQSQCESSLYRFKGSDYNRFIRNLSQYDYSFTEVSRRNFVPETFVRWVRKWLAYYSVGKNLSAYGISIPADAPQQMPAGKVFPSGGASAIKSPTCRAALSQF